MRTARVSWTLPAVRESGLALAVGDIAGVEVSLSADGGQNFATLDTVAPPETSLEQTELDPGDWIFRLVVIDSEDRRSSPVDTGFSIADDSPPGTVTDVVVDILPPG